MGGSGLESLQRETALHRRAKSDALAAASAHEQEHAAMHEEHVEVLRKVDVLRSGGYLSDDSDDDLELGLVGEDEVEEARSLAAQADRLIASGDLDGAERLLAEAERAEVEAGLGPSPRSRSKEEARSLAAQADRLIAGGDFAGAERLLADAERVEVEAGLAPSPRSGSKEEARLLAAQADRLIAGGDFAGAERLLARAEQDVS
eukprot:COSAG02_NODE_356_length_23978_cov_7.868504_17_plen_204_part_00